MSDADHLRNWQRTENPTLGGYAIFLFCTERGVERVVVDELLPYTTMQQNPRGCLHQQLLPPHLADEFGEVALANAVERRALRG